MALEEKLFVGREEAAEMLSISRRSLDYLLAKKQLTFRRIRVTGVDSCFRPQALLQSRPSSAIGRINFLMPCCLLL